MTDLIFLRPGLGPLPELVIQAADRAAPAQFLSLTEQQLAHLVADGARFLAAIAEARATIAAGHDLERLVIERNFTAGFLSPAEYARKLADLFARGATVIHPKTEKPSPSPLVGEGRGEGSKGS